jgi:hypothetical protein
LFFLEELKRIKEKNLSKIALFIDMDGVVADYRFGEGKNIENNVPGTYLNKRPIMTVINILKDVSNNFDFDMYILSSCRYKEQAIEKSKWLKKYMPFINKQNQLFVISNTFEDRKMLKINEVKQLINKRYDKVIMIDDTHDILFLAIKELGDKVIPYHVITLLD